MKVEDIKLSSSSIFSCSFIYIAVKLCSKNSTAHDLSKVQEHLKNFFLMSVIVKNVLRLLSMLSLQQQNTIMNNHNSLGSSINPMIPTMTGQSIQQQQDNQFDRSSINSQQCLADKIQAVRHLWESENQYSNSSQHVHPMTNYNQQQNSSVVDPNLCNHMNNTFQQGTHGFIQFQ